MPKSTSCLPRRWILRTLLCSLALPFVTSGTALADDTKVCDIAPMHGFNLIQDTHARFGSSQALISMQRMRASGANTVAFVPFLWQRKPDSVDIVRGSDMSDGELAQGIRAAHRLGMRVIVKPQVWVPDTWAGAVHMNNDADWAAWFAHYQTALLDLAAVAQREHAEGFVIGTELDQTVTRAAWPALIARVRGVFRGKLTYVAHNVEGAQQVPFWPSLDEIGVTLYPSLTDDTRPDEWLRVMRATSSGLQDLSRREGRPVMVAEIGLRSAKGAAAKPWESAEERRAQADDKLQSDVLHMWLTTLDRQRVQTVLVWRWISRPDAGGRNDTDFTVQGKEAERMLTSAWTNCVARPVAAAVPATVPATFARRAPASETAP
jgi:hypothetical protein